MPGHSITVSVNSKAAFLFDACHEKTDLKVFVVVIPKEGWARAHPSFGMTPTFREYNL